MCHPYFLLAAAFRHGHCIQSRFLRNGDLPYPMGLALEEGEWPSLLLFSMEGDAP